MTTRRNFLVLSGVTLATPSLPQFASAPVSSGPRPSSLASSTIEKFKVPSSPAAPFGIPPYTGGKHWRLVYDPIRRDHICSFGDYSAGRGSNSHPEVYSYKVATNQWTVELNSDAANDGHKFPRGVCIPGACFDKKRGVMWKAGGQERTANYPPNLVSGGLWAYRRDRTWHQQGISPKVDPAAECMLRDETADALYILLSGVVEKFNLHGVVVGDGVIRDNWTRISIPISDAHINTANVFAMDTKRRRIVFYCPTLKQTWAFNIVTETCELLSNQAIPVQKEYTLVYDEFSDQVLMIGGYIAGTYGKFPTEDKILRDLWVMDGSGVWSIPQVTGAKLVDDRAFIGAWAASYDSDEKCTVVISSPNDVYGERFQPPDDALFIIRMMPQSSPGTALPAWVPSPGTIKNISLNTLADVDPCPTRKCSYSGIMGQAGMFAWSGAAYVDDDGPYGAIGFCGGGHADYFGNEVYHFPFDTRRWERMCEPSTIGPATPVDDWGEYPGGSPATGHTYGHLQQLSTALGGGPKGSTLLLCGYSLLSSGSGHTGASHRFDHATGEWSRYSANRCAMPPSAQATCFDSTRSCFWKVSGSGGVLSKLDTATKTWTDLEVSTRGGNAFQGEAVCAYCQSLDVIVLINHPRDGSGNYTRPVQLWALSPNSLSSGWEALTQAGDMLPQMRQTAGCSLEYSPLLGKFGSYDGQGHKYMRYLTPPAVLTDPWIWRRETFRGDPPAYDPKLPWQNYNRMRWVPKLRSWMWFASRSLPVQLWRPRGT